ncbi:TetR/AcrR family transcriptional regulator [Hazenella sp. IB182357]|uniref:TetR/AcrR family transcriptional regulator n=1 Tax=Polycladospora coralii TaxID=2771432 RepID=A0A926NBX1_9BACL|nr:TetR/AcrR family transcriptional regulator [Polycladospora coralii]MBD1373422.1 TetR/AcrR family transcriptional regulator [Polycladospora coralii]
MREEKKTTDKSKKREEIMDGAIKAFEIEGYEKASMDRIAHHAGTTKRTVYNHFASKGDLFQAVFERFLSEQSVLRAIKYDSDQSLTEQLVRFVDAELYLSTEPSRLAISQVLITQFMQDPHVALEARAKYGSSHTHFVTWIEAAIEDERIEATDPNLAALIFYSMIEGGLTWPILCQTEKPPESFKDELIKTFLCRFEKSPVSG